MNFPSADQLKGLVKKLKDPSFKYHFWVVWGGLFALLVLVFGLVCFPIQRKSGERARTLKAKRQEVLQAKTSGMSLLNPSETAKFQYRFQSFKAGLIKISQAPAVLNAISEQAQKSRVRVTGIDSQNPAPLMDASGKTLTCEGLGLSRLPIVIHLQGTYTAIGDFLGALHSSSTGVFAVDSFECKKQDLKSPVLDGSLTLSFYANGA